MKKVNKKAATIRQRKAEKKAKRSRKNKTVRMEAINHKANVVMAKRQELFDKWVAAVGQHFESNSKGK